MAYDEREAILAALATAAAGWTVGNGYNVTLAALYREHELPEADVLTQNITTGMPHAYLVDGEEDGLLEKSQSAHEFWIFRPHLVVVADADAATPSTSLNALIADGKLLVRNNRRPTTACTYARVRRVVPNPQFTKPHSAANLELEVRYETSA